MDCGATAPHDSDGRIQITELPNRRYRIETKPGEGESVELSSCETSFPREIIEYAAEKFPYCSLCSWIARHEDSEFIGIIRHQLFSYCRPADLAGKRLLDFGCGSGASTFAIAAVLPRTEIIGVDLNREEIDVAKKIAEVKKVPNVRFLLSPAGDQLPPNIGLFDYVTLNAVYEHLLPNERKIIMPLLWSSMKPGGVLFVNQTPYRYFPYEHHSTKLWLINYLPDSLTHLLARKFARLNPQVNRSEHWEVLLRGGIRGATEGEIIRNLVGDSGGKARILQPSGKDIFDRASYWLSETNPSRHRLLKRMVAFAFRCSDRLFGTIPSTTVDLAVRKETPEPLSARDALAAPHHAA